jgi:hypothetical protein
VISSRLPPSRWLGSVATCIHAPNFSCFLSTARRFFISRQWEIAVFVGDPSIDKSIRLLAQASYAKGMPRPEVYKAHEAITEHINARGSGSSLHHEVTSVFEDFEAIGALRNLRIRPYGMLDHLGR